MSLILDALKRAERERHAERSAALEELPASVSPRRRRRWGRWLIIGLLAVVVGAVALSVTRRPKSTAAAARPAAPAPASRPAPTVQAPAAQPAQPSTQAPASETEQTAPQPPNVVLKPAPSPDPILARPAPSIVPGTEGVASLDDLTPDSDIELEPAAPPPAPSRAEATPPPELTVEPEPAPAEDAEESAAEPEPAPARPAAPATTTPRPVPPVLTQKVPPRKLREMPPDYRADFPALTVEVHVFEPGRRFVMINGRRYREGERLAEGPQIVEIVRDGIVMDYRGERVLFTLGR